MREPRGSVTGIGLMVVSVGSFAVMHALMKSLTPYYPPLQLAALRGLTSLPLVICWVWLCRESARAFQVRWPLQLVRGLFSLLAGITAIFALKVMPLADAYSILLSAPLIIAALSSPLLRERVDLGRWLVIIAGFVGVLIVLRPRGAGMLTLGGIVMVASALTYSLAVLATRTLARTDATTSTVLWTTIVVSAGASLLALPGWLHVRSEHWPRLAAVGLLGALGQYAITAALRRAPASVIAPFEYTALAWGLGIDWIVWGTLPNPAMLAGSAMIVASGLYLVARERMRERRAAIAPSAARPE